MTGVQTCALPICNLTVPYDHFIGFVGEDANWGMGYMHANYTKQTVHSSIDLRVGSGHYISGDDGFSIGQTNGVSLFEINGYTTDSWFRGNITAANNINVGQHLQFNDGSMQTSAFQLYTGDTAPANTHSLWFNTTDGRSYIYYNNQWIDSNPVVPQPLGLVGQLEFENTTWIEGGYANVITALNQQVVVSKIGRAHV